MRNGKQPGFAYLSVLIIVAVMSIMALKLSGDLSVRLMREKEADLLFNGDQIAQAIKSYYESGPVRGCYPPNLDVLLEDRRDLRVMRHLRKMFPDPMHMRTEGQSSSQDDIETIGNGGWGLIMNESDHIMGVFSKSQMEPFKQNGFSKGRKDFDGKSQYSDWKFTARGSAVAPASPAVCKQ
ncbi:type II secretion system protein [Glaciimonas sp. Gout2]|uniref:type II secretion system protein n=1 Tax=unclassified Glaciimonas TaxID=2644401 RepID=UPI002AB49CDE|nr:MULTISPECIES: type II secretion system protein [unclassified Glaciimonas]MDY7548511.1 type II secretion system protein [Glaciimonas sp. CA11.2]MEB0013701.1 type II secretion system protein [Glaciimonas sp. Cout2]MEB0084882.1 type II secretion system protein [Glaciimonas sp. Gout2]